MDLFSRWVSQIPAKARPAPAAAAAAASSASGAVFSASTADLGPLRRPHPRTRRAPASTSARTMPPPMALVLSLLISIAILSSWPSTVHAQQQQMAMGSSSTTTTTALQTTTTAGISSYMDTASSSTTHTSTYHPQHRQLATSTAVGQFPIETYYLPLKEHDIYNAMRTIQEGGVFDEKPRIVSITSISIAADDTIIWYDHHEDGYESDITDPTNLQNTTEIWGDGDCSNGSPPNVGTCQNDNDDDDRLTAGMAINIINDVPLSFDSNTAGPRINLTTNITYDGGDKLDSTFPVAITRGGYPYVNDLDTNPLFAGAVEVLNTENYGTEFISPVGTDTENATATRDQSNNVQNAAFEQTELHIMALKKNTVVTLTKSNGDTSNHNIGAGQSQRIEGITEGDTITTASGYPVQVHLITGDIGKDETNLSHS